MLEPGQTVLYGTEESARSRAIETLRIGESAANTTFCARCIARARQSMSRRTTSCCAAGCGPFCPSRRSRACFQSAAGESISWIDDPNERKQVFAQILSGGDRRRVLHLIRMLYVRRRELQKNGKHLRIADEQTLRDAEKLLNDEFAHVLHPAAGRPGLHPQPDGAGGLRRRDPQRINRRNHHGKKSTRKRHLRPSARILRQ